jgi:AAA domain
MNPAATAEQHSTEGEAAAAMDRDLERQTSSYLAELDPAERQKAEERINAALKLKAPIEEAEERSLLPVEPGLADRMGTERRVPVQLIDGLLVRRRIHLLIGHPSNGKTTIAMWAAKDHMERGGDVLYIDWEETPDDIAAKLADMGIDPELVAERFHYSWKPDLQANEEGTRQLVGRIEVIQAPHDGDDDYPGVLVILDSMDMALTIAGFDPNDRGESSRWAQYLSHPAKAAGATVVIIDAPAKNGSEKNPYPAGAGTKLFQADAGWYVKAAVPFKRDRIGRIEVIRPPGGKERTGTLPERLAYEVGDGRGGLPVTRVEVEDEGTRSKREADKREKVLAVLQEHTAPDKRLSGRQIAELVTGKATDTRERLKELAAEPASGVCNAPGARRSVEYWYDAESVTGLDIRGDGPVEGA